MVPMRAMFVLAAILSFATPQVSWGATEHSLSSSGAMVLSSPASGVSQISRAALFTAFVALFPPIGSPDSVAAQTCDAPHLDLEGPPLAPRPPPAR